MIVFMINNEKWYTVQELVQRYGDSDQAIRDRIRAGHFPGARRKTLAQRAPWLVPQSAVDRYDRRLAGTAINPY